MPATLADIERKVRLLARVPSIAQLSQADLDNYINTFILYDFPEHLRTFNLRRPFTFYTNPGQDVYDTNINAFAGAVDNVLYNFQNLNITVHEPIFIAGFPALYSQDRQQFFGIYPIINSIASIGVTGNGTAGPFVGVVNSQQAIVPPGFTQNIGLLQRNVLFTAIGTAGVGQEQGMALQDIPIVDAGTGYKLNMGNLYDPNTAAYRDALVNPPTIVDPNNNINYLTGVFTINFPLATVAGTPINSQTVPQQYALPQSLLYHNNQFTVRPVPDQSYAINIEVYARPTALLAAGDIPELEEYWQYIAYGAAIKVLQDKMDLDSVTLIMPEFKEQQRLCNRRTIVQYTGERTATIYTENNNGSGNWTWGFGSGLL
jgi:hypothetical protein